MAKKNILNDVSHDAPAPSVQISSTAMKVKIKDIKISELNPRSDLDYEDPSFQDALRKTSGPVKNIAVVTTEDNPDKYEIIAGNRTFFNYRRVLELDGKLEDDTEILVTVRWYEGEEKAIELQIINELELDNSHQQTFTPVDKLNLLKRKRDLGMSIDQMAQDLKVSKPYIYQIFSLERLPQRILDLLHWSFREDLLARRDKSILEQYNIFHDVNEDGGFVIHGLNYNSAIELARCLPAPPTKGKMKKAEHEEAIAEWEKSTLQVWIDALLDETFLEAACRTKSVDFSGVLDAHLVSKGLREATAPVAAEPVKSKADLALEREAERQAELDKVIPPKPNFPDDWDEEDGAEAAEVAPGEVLSQREALLKGAASELPRIRPDAPKPDTISKTIIDKAVEDRFAVTKPEKHGSKHDGSVGVEADDTEFQSLDIRLTERQELLSDLLKDYPKDFLSRFEYLELDYGKLEKMLKKSDNKEAVKLILLLISHDLLMDNEGYTDPVYTKVR